MPSKEIYDLASLDPSSLVELVGDQKTPPVHLWNPQNSSDNHMRIDREGRWFHRGDPIKRPAMVALFSSILRREEDGQYALVTPYEKQFITVEDAPFMAIDMQYNDDMTPPQLAFQLNTGALTVADAEHLVRAVPAGDDVQFYVTVRPGLEARLNRSTHLALVNLLLDQATPGVLPYADQTLVLDIAAE